METRVLLLDLVKAFDRVSRELLWSIMERFGFPEKIVSLLRALHAKVLVNFEVEGVRKVIEGIIGVKQGDLLGPILFNILRMCSDDRVAEDQSWHARDR